MEFQLRFLDIGPIVLLALLLRQVRLDFSKYALAALALYCVSAAAKRLKRGLDYRLRGDDPGPFPV